MRRLRLRVLLPLLPLLPLWLAAPAAAEPAADDAIRFRPLTRSDFLAQRPPADLAHHGGNLEAASCLRIMWPSDLRIELSPAVQGGGAVLARIADPVFFAVFERSCSWWAPEPEDPAYALEHEQVHFAIAERFARELTRDMKGRVLGTRGPSREEAIASLRGQLRRLASRAMIAARREHGAFDVATRDDAARAAHREWVRRYRALLGGD